MPLVPTPPILICKLRNLPRAVVPLVECQSYQASPDVVCRIALVPLRDRRGGNGLHASLRLEPRM